MGTVKNLINKKFGRLTVTSITNKRKRGSVVWICKCSCGNIKMVSSWGLSSGDTQSCGCIRKDLLKSGNIRRTHGLRKNPLYWIWSTMKSRCLNINNLKYPRYGGRGITIDKSWMIFENFYKDMHKGYAHGLQIDRIDNNQGYRKDNCRWVTCKVNNNNRYY